MRTTLATVVALGMLAAPAAAHPTGGGRGGGGGALGHVSRGLGEATGGGRRTDHRSDDRERPVRIVSEQLVIVHEVDPRNPDDIPRGVTPPGTAKLDLYVGTQKVHDSDGAFSVEAALVDGWARVGGSVTQFFERQADGRTLTLTVPTFTVGARIDDGGPTRVYIEGGVVGAKTKHDPVMDTSIIGAIGGVRVKHRLGRGTALIGDAQVMAFEAGVRARAMRVGVLVGPVQASLRVFDFNIGPALYGPEVGFRF